jgi:hypothetical protein
MWYRLDSQCSENEWWNHNASICCTWHDSLRLRSIYCGSSFIDACFQSVASCSSSFSFLLVYVKRRVFGLWFCMLLIKRINDYYCHRMGYGVKRRIFLFCYFDTTSNSMVNYLVDRVQLIWINLCLCFCILLRKSTLVILGWTSTLDFCVSTGCRIRIPYNF